MADAGNILKILIQSIKDSGNFNVVHFEDMQYRDYPFTASTKFIRAIIEIHKELLEQLSKLETVSCATPQELEDRLIEARRFGQLFSRMHTLLQILEMGGREYVPEFITQLIGERIKLINKKAEFIFLPDYEYNYAYSELIAGLSEALRDAVDDIDKKLSFAKKLAIFWFPLAHKDDMLLNNLLGHELGHFVNEEKGIVNKLIPKITLPQTEIELIATIRLQTKVKTEKKDIKMDEYFGIDSLKVQVKQDVTKKISNQLKELVSDSTGFCIFGPAFLIAQFNYLVSLASMEHEAEGYPTVRTRLSFLIGLFDYMGYPRILNKKRSCGIKRHEEMAESFSETIEVIRKMISLNGQGTLDKEEELIRSSVHNLKKILWQAVRRAVRKQEYSPKTFSDDVFKLADLIDSIVPPTEIEIEHPANTISILNAGVLYEITSINRMHTNFEDTTLVDHLATRNKLHQLIMKAGELSQIQTLLQTEKKSHPS
jgi:hypothetical protein